MTLCHTFLKRFEYEFAYFFPYVGTSHSSSYYMYFIYSIVLHNINMQNHNIHIKNISYGTILRLLLVYLLYSVTMKCWYTTTNLIFFDACIYYIYYAYYYYYYIIIIIEHENIIIIIIIIEHEKLASVAK